MPYKALARIKRKTKNKMVFLQELVLERFFFLVLFLGALMKNGIKEIKVQFIQSAYEQGGDLPSGKKNGSLIT